MVRIVMKFGGTSVADIGRIRAVAERIKSEVDAGNQVAVVVSAMAGVTDNLAGYADQISSSYDLCEYDVIVSTGEQVTSGLLALALQERGVPARSWLGWQIPVHTDNASGKARITGINADRMIECLEKGKVAIVPGFQGVDPSGRITTLGRGGSDTSAVAVAAAVGADLCDVYTDVDGVYTSDPRIVAKARKLNKITYEEMLEMASVGAKVLQARSVEMALKHGVRVQVRSSYSDQSGTFVVDEDEIMEQEIVSGIVCDRSESKIALVRVADCPGVAVSIFGPLAEESINVDMIVQSMSVDAKATDLTFTVAKMDLPRAVAVLEARREALGYQELAFDPDVAKISVVGVGMRSHAGVAQKMFGVLAEKGINIQVISTSEIKISVLIDEEYAELALRALHSAYGLDQKEE